MTRYDELAAEFTQFDMTGLAKDWKDAIARLVRISQATTWSVEDAAGAVSEYVLKGLGSVEEALEALERRYGVEREDGRCGRSE